jgi:hypothetical protein
MTVRAANLLMLSQRLAHSWFALLNTDRGIVATQATRVIHIVTK